MKSVQYIKLKTSNRNFVMGYKPEAALIINHLLNSGDCNRRSAKQNLH